MMAVQYPNHRIVEKYFAEGKTFMSYTTAFKICYVRFYDECVDGSSYERIWTLVLKVKPLAIRNINDQVNMGLADRVIERKFLHYFNLDSRHYQVRVYYDREKFNQ